MNAIDKTKKPKKGRPPVDTEAVNLRLPRDFLDAIDGFRRAEEDLPTRPEAVRRILRDWLVSKGLLTAGLRHPLKTPSGTTDD